MFRSDTPPLPPGPATRHPLGSTLPFKDAPLDYIRTLAAEHGDVVRFKVGGKWWTLVVHPDDIWDICVKRQARFTKPPIVGRLWSQFLGNGLLSTDGEFWKRQHKMIRPGFHRERIDAYAAVMVAYTRRMIDRWEQGERLPVDEEMTALTLEVVAKTLFDADVRRDSGTVGEAMKVLNQVMLEHIHFPVPVPRWWPSAANKRKIKALDDIEGIILRIIAERRAEGVDRGDLLSMLVFARDEAGGGMHDRQLRDEAMTLFFAGHETTSMALSWMWYLMAAHPEHQQRLREEIRREVGDRPLSVGDLKQLPYLDLVVKECMRILPAVWTFMRAPREDDVVGGYRVSAGEILLISPFVTHHDPRFFPEPEVFRPERFSREAAAALPNGAYIPFAVGQRMCLGKAFAEMEARLILGTLVQNLNIRLEEGYELSWEALLSLQPRGGLPAVVEKLAT
jgi:cytochrome P450